MHIPMGTPGQPVAGAPDPGLAAANPAFGNPMFQMFQMFQAMAAAQAGQPLIDPSALPFTPTAPVPQDGDLGLDAKFIRPALLSELLRDQAPLPTGTVLDLLCLSPDRTTALGGLPKGTTIAFAGPPGRGKTRTALATLCRVAATGQAVGLVVAEEGFHDATGSGRDDLCSRLCRIGMLATGLDEVTLREQVLKNLWVIESQYHKGQTWDDFIARYRYLVEKAGVRFIVIDSLNMLDPTRNRTADNLSALKTYNHEHGVTALCIGQIRDTGQPVGGEALMHTADVVLLLEEIGLTSKEMAEQWNGKYRDRIVVIHAVKSVTTPTLPHPLRVSQEEGTGALVVSPDHPSTTFWVPNRP